MPWEELILSLPGYTDEDFTGFGFTSQRNYSYIELRSSLKNMRAKQEP